mmetsp:Transcript_86338/g.222365  ORF Transcript_86338/g.222365 Transcript_86338/m.222365 type:complete len:304 (+) Transcript_86338:962-1873(+)
MRRARRTRHAAERGLARVVRDVGARQAQWRDCQWLLRRRHTSERASERARLGHRRRPQGVGAVHCQVHLLLRALGLQPDLRLHQEVKGQRRRPGARRGKPDGQNARQAEGGISGAQRLRAAELPDCSPARAARPLCGCGWLDCRGVGRLRQGEARSHRGVRPSGRGRLRGACPHSAGGADIVHTAQRMQGGAVPALPVPAHPGGAGARAAGDVRRRGSLRRKSASLRLCARHPREAAPLRHVGRLARGGPRRGLRLAQRHRAHAEPHGRTGFADPGGRLRRRGTPLQGALHLPAAGVRQARPR